MIFSPVVTIPKPTWRLAQRLVGELSYVQDGEDVTGLDLDSMTEKFIQRIVDEYVREYFEESTRMASEKLNYRGFDLRESTRRSRTLR